MATYYSLDPEARRRRRPGAYDDSAWPDLSSLRVAESTSQHSIIQVVTSSLEKLIELRGWPNLHVSGHTFFASNPEDPNDRIAPDVYLFEAEGPQPNRSIWETWKPDFHRPRWVLEVASGNKWRKDYDSPPKYARLGCSEMVIFDPRLVTEPHRRYHPRRSALTIYRFGPRGEVRRVYSGKGPAYSKELKVWLAATMSWNEPMLRLWFDKNGKRVVPTHAEAGQHAKRQIDEEKRRADVAERRADEERTEKERQVGEAKRQINEEKRRADVAERRTDKAERQIDEEKRRADKAERQIDEEKRRADEIRTAKGRLAERMRDAGLDPDHDP